MNVVRTVLGDVPPSALGVVDYHEHLFQATPLLSGDELDDEALSAEEARRMLRGGVTSMVEATPLGLGRNPEGLARISAATGMHLVHTTGLHHGGHYAADHPLRDATPEDLGERFTAEIAEGMRTDDGGMARTPDGDPIRAGVVKAAARYWSIGEFEQKALIAAAIASRATGCAIMVHLEHGSAAHEVLDHLESEGIAPRRVVLAHIDRNLDAGLHAELARRGAYLGFDGPARHRESPDSAIIACIADVVARGGGTRIVIGGDVARSTRYRAYGGIPGLEYLPLRFLPRLAERVSDDAFSDILTRNPARLLALSGDSASG
ncbi:phosphotriesterase family protein [Microbacterium sp. I2]|uniref:phosphotriesterase family protein n=1 Tax=Microbacterium sp. I2 TaxID=3391826 RepID=UPI003ED86A9C